MTIEKDIWLGRDNEFVLEVNTSDRDCALTPVDFTSVTQVEFSIGDYTATTTNGDADWSVNWWDGRLDTGQVAFKLGQWAETAGVPTGSYLAKLVAFDIPSPGGLVVISRADKDLRIIVNEGD